VLAEAITAHLDAAGQLEQLTRAKEAAVRQYDEQIEEAGKTLERALNARRHFETTVPSSVVLQIRLEMPPYTTWTPQDLFEEARKQHRVPRNAILITWVEETGNEFVVAETAYSEGGSLYWVTPASGAAVFLYRNGPLPSETATPGVPMG
jgi:hypothetical protein